MHNPYPGLLSIRGLMASQGQPEEMLTAAPPPDHELRDRARAAKLRHRAAKAKLKAHNLKVRAKHLEDRASTLEQRADALDGVVRTPSVAPAHAPPSPPQLPPDE